MFKISPAVQDRLHRQAADLCVCLRFCTRLPIPQRAFEKPGTAEGQQQEAQAPYAPSLAAAAAMFPVAGALIGASAALVLWFFAKPFSLPITLAALVAISFLIVLTGALHEDGLADFADAFGGANAEQRLAIMKDSRIGSFGSLALIIVVLGRVMSLALLSEHSLGLASAVLISVGASSRLFALVPLYILPPARAEGLGTAVAGLRQKDLAFAGLAALIIGLIPLFAGAGFWRVVFALLAGAAAAYGATLLARRLLQGQTGDVAGAAQQVAELASLLVFTARL